MSSVRLMVLGVLESSSSLHGYKIYRHLNDWRAETWTAIKPGSIYHALTFLEKNGHIDNAGTKPDSGGPSATSYSINDRGREELYRLINDALVSYDQEFFTAGIAWMHLLKREEVLNLTLQRLEQYKQTSVFMCTLPRDEMPSTPDKHPEILDSWTALYDATAKWLESFVGHIKAGRYHFKDE